jgi:hypothetical protein
MRGENGFWIQMEGVLDESFLERKRKRLIYICCIYDLCMRYENNLSPFHVKCASHTKHCVNLCKPMYFGKY